MCTSGNEGLIHACGDFNYKYFLDKIVRPNTLDRHELVGVSNFYDFMLPFLYEWTSYNQSISYDFLFRASLATTFKYGGSNPPLPQNLLQRLTLSLSWHNLDTIPYGEFAIPDRVLVQPRKLLSLAYPKLENGHFQVSQSRSVNGYIFDRCNFLTCDVI